MNDFHLIFRALNKKGLHLRLTVEYDFLKLESVFSANGNLITFALFFLVGLTKNKGDLFIDEIIKAILAI